MELNEIKGSLKGRFFKRQIWGGTAIAIHINNNYNPWKYIHKDEIEKGKEGDVLAGGNLRGNDWFECNINGERIKTKEISSSWMQNAINDINLELGKKNE